MTLLRKLTLAAALAAVLGITGAGAVAVPVAQAPDRPPGQARAAAPKQAAGRAKPARVTDVPSRREGTLLFVATEVRKGEKVPPRDELVWTVGNEARTLRRLRVGDHVEKGQLLAVLDDKLARIEVANAEAKIVAARAALEAAQALAKEAEARLRRLEDLKNDRTVGEAEYKAALLIRDRYFQEEVSKKAEVTLAQVSLQQAELVLEMHQIRSPVRGTIVTIFKQRGEAVRQNEPVLRIRIDDADAKANPR